MITVTNFVVYKLFGTAFQENSLDLLDLIIAVKNDWSLYYQLDQSSIFSVLKSVQGRLSVSVVTQLIHAFRWLALLDLEICFSKFSEIKDVCKF